MTHIRIGKDGMECTICGAAEKVKYPIAVDRLNEIGEAFSNKHLHSDTYCITCGVKINSITNDLWCDKCFEEHLK